MAMKENKIKMLCFFLGVQTRANPSDSRQKCTGWSRSRSGVTLYLIFIDSVRMQNVSPGSFVSKAWPRARPMIFKLRRLQQYTQGHLSLKVGALQGPEGAW